MPFMVTISVKLPAVLKNQAEAEARLSGKSVSALVRESLSTRISLKKGSKKISLYQKSKNLCGCLDSGITDLATNPKYMKGFGEWRR